MNFLKRAMHSPNPWLLQFSQETRAAQTWRRRHTFHMKKTKKNKIRTSRSRICFNIFIIMLAMMETKKMFRIMNVWHSELICNMYSLELHIPLRYKQIKQLSHTAYGVRYLATRTIHLFVHIEQLNEIKPTKESIQSEKSVAISISVRAFGRVCVLFSFCSISFFFVFRSYCFGGSVRWRVRSASIYDGGGASVYITKFGHMCVSTAAPCAWWIVNFRRILRSVEHYGDMADQWEIRKCIWKQRKLKFNFIVFLHFPFVWFAFRTHLTILM